MKKPYTLFTPGPVAVPDEILKEASRPIIYHREDKFHKLFFALQEHLKKILLTKNKVFIFAASGTGAMEACVANLVSRNEKALVLSCGRFGERWRELLRSYGAYVDIYQAPDGYEVPPEELERKLKTDDTIKFVFTTLTDTSTGVLQDIKTFGRITRENARILVVDGICGVGADAFSFDDFKVDVVCGASQKALGGIPGISFVTINERAWEIVTKSHSPRYYFDLKNYDRFLEKGETPFTPSINVLYVFYSALEKINKMGVKKYWQRHQNNANFVRRLFKEKGFEFFPNKPSNALTVLKMPENIDATAIIRKAKEEYRVLFSNGQAHLKGKIIRFSHMGFCSRQELKKGAQILIKLIPKAKL